MKAGQTPGFPRFKSWRRFDSVEWPDVSGWKVDEKQRRLYVQGVGHLKLRLHRGLRGTPKTITVSRQAGRWRVTVFCVDVPSQPLPANGQQIGLDVGVNVLAGLSDGRLIANPRHLAHSRDRLARAQQLVAGRRRGSARLGKAAARVGAIHRTVRHQRRDALHQLSRSLVNDHDLIAVEGLKITNLTRRPKPVPDGAGGFAPNGAAAKAGLNRSILDAGWGTLLAMLTYKAEDAGRELIVVDPRHTSQRCANCGHIDARNRHDTVFRCLGCGHTDHADVNAAVNILGAGLALRRAREASRAVA